MTGFELRPVPEDEREHIFDAYKLTLGRYVDWAWGWDEDFQRNGFWEHNPVEHFRGIFIDGELAGGIYTEQQATLDFVRLIFLLPAFQGRGVGSKVLLNEAKRAAQAGKQLHLKVVKINPAKKLYDRMGFVLIEESDVTYHMRLG